MFNSMVLMDLAHLSSLDKTLVSCLDAAVAKAEAKNNTLLIIIQEGNASSQ